MMSKYPQRYTRGCRWRPITPTGEVFSHPDYECVLHFTGKQLGPKRFSIEYELKIINKATGEESHDFDLRVVWHSKGCMCGEHGWCYWHEEENLWAIAKYDIKLEAESAAERALDIIKRAANYDPYLDGNRCGECGKKIRRCYCHIQKVKERPMKLNTSPPEHEWVFSNRRYYG